MALLAQLEAAKLAAVQAEKDRIAREKAKIAERKKWL